MRTKISPGNVPELWVKRYKVIRYPLEYLNDILLERVT